MAHQHILSPFLLLKLCHDDGSLGPASACRSLDFTLYFEASVLLITVDALFIVCAALKLYSLRTATSTVAFRGLRSHAKAAAALFVLASCIATLITYIQDLQSLLPAIFLPAWIVSLTSAVLLLVLAWAEHTRSPTPSTLILCYAFCKGLFSIAVLRTLRSIGVAHGPSTSMALLIASYFSLCLLELIEKKALMPADQRQKLVGEASMSFVNRNLFFWLFPLMWRGRQTKLTLDSLGRTPEENRAVPTRLALLAFLDTSKSSSPLFTASFGAFGAGLFMPTIPRAIVLLATFSQPLLVNRMISFVQDSSQSTESGWGLVGGFVCAYGLMTVATAVYWEKVYAVSVRYRAALVGAIYDKTLRLAAHSGRSVGSAGASTYMSVDVERITKCIELIHEFWAAFVSIPIATALLYSQASWAAFTPLAVVFILLAITSRLSKIIGARHVVWLGMTDRRVKLLNSILSQFLPIKMSGYEDHLARKVIDLRTREVNAIYSLYSAIVWTSGLSNSAALFCSFAVLATYAVIAKSHARGYDLDITRIFTILTTVNILNGPLNVLGQCLPEILAGYTSLKRIQSFLLLDEKRQEDAGLLENERKISINTASFSWSKDSVPVLRDIDLTLREGQLTVLVGPVASGKTTLLVSMLGETTLVNGTILRPATRIAYATQDAFIFAETCRENITFGSSYDKVWYDRVVDACGLTRDLQHFPNGDLTKLGDKGTTMSGGQRQRIALARAVYAKASISLLDDVLSALDGETEKHVFESLFGKEGLLKGKTVVLVTNNTRHLAASDWVLVLDKGMMIHQGTLENIQLNGYDPAGSVMSSSSSKTKGNDSNSTESFDKPKPTWENEVSTGNSDEDETVSTGVKPYVFFASMIGYHRALVSIILIVVYCIIQLGVQFYLKSWAESNGTSLSYWLGGYVLLSFVGLISGLVVFSQYFTSASLNGGNNTHMAALTAVFRAPTAYFLSTPAGRIMNRFSSDMFATDFSFPLAMLNAVATFFTLVGYLILIFLATPWITACAPVLGLAYWLLIQFYLETSKQLQQLEAASKTPLYATFGNTLSDIETIRAFRAESYFQRRNDDALDRSQGPLYYRFAGIRFLRASLSFIIMLIAVTIAVFAVGMRHSTSAGLLGIALSNMTNLAAMLSHFMMSYSQIENGSVSVRRVYDMTTIAPERDLGTSMPENKNGGDSWPVRGGIVFDNFSMRYREDLPLALKSFSFAVKGGQKIGICGRTGSGKSSTVTALFRSIDQSLVSGRILLDDIDISTVPLSQLRDSLSLVSQEPFLWHAPLRELLDIEEIHTDEEIWCALKQVEMKEFVAALPEKLDTIIEDGGSLSRGQKQLICLARVLLRKTRVIIFDEATSSMDLRTDEKIREVIHQDLIGQTIIAVAHRIATIIDFDLILVLDDGNIAEYGSPAELLADPQSRFSQLAVTQGDPVAGYANCMG